MENSTFIPFSRVGTKLSFPIHKTHYLMHVDTLERVNNDRRSVSYTMNISIDYPKTNVPEERYCILRFGHPYFNPEKEYSKEQWIYAKLSTINEELHIKVSAFGQMERVENKEEILHKLTQLRTEMQESVFGETDLVITSCKNMENNLSEHFQETYMNDMILQWLCNDIFREYHGPRKSISTSKQLIGHFGWHILPMIEDKWLEELNPLNDWILLKTEGAVDVEQMDMVGIGNYLFQKLGDVGVTNYNVKSSGSYQYSTRENNITEVFFQLSGTIGTCYEKTTTLNLKLKPHG